MIERAAWIALALALGPATAHAQSVTDGSDTVIGPERAHAVLELIRRQPLSADAHVTGLREGRAGALCGAVDVMNRMGVHTGPRPFVADLSSGFAGKLPEGPELRSPPSIAAFRDMERAKSLFAAHCTAP